MGENMRIYERVKAVPTEAKKPIMGGRLKGMTDINPMWRIKKLTEEFGPCGIGWYYKRIDKWREEFGNGEVAVFVEIELYYKDGDQWSAPVYGTGGSMVGSNESRGFYVNDEAYKMATTDAISVACKNLGVAADIYFEKDNTKYNDVKRENVQQAPTQIPHKSEAQMLQELHEASEAETMAEQPRRLTPKEQVKMRMQSLDPESVRELCEPITSAEMQTLTEYANGLGIPMGRIVEAYDSCAEHHGDQRKVREEGKDCGERSVRYGTVGFQNWRNGRCR